jgi:hypothetical protein
MNTVNGRIATLAMTIISVIVTLLLIDPHEINLAVPSMISMVFVYHVVIKVFVLKDLKSVYFVIPLSLTWVYFCVPFLYSEPVEHAYRIIPAAYLLEMSIFSSLSVIALWLGYYYPLSNKVKAISSIHIQFNIVTLQKLFLSLVLIAIIQRFLEMYAHWTYSWLGQMAQVFEFSQEFAIVVGFLYIIRGGRSRLTILLFFSFFSFELFFRVSDTLFSKVFFLIISLLLTYFLQKKAIPWKMAILVFLVSLSLFDARKDYRYSHVVDRWYYGGSQDMTSRINDGFDYIFTNFKFYDIDTINQTLTTQGKNRMEQISFLGQVVHMVEIEDKGYKYGETLWFLPLSVVPRIIFPWKPKSDLASNLAKEYGVKQGDKGAANWPLLVEYYINFGFFSMIFFSFLQGIFTQWTLKKAAYGIGDINLLIAINLLWHIIKVETSVVLTLGGFLQVLLSWWLITKVINHFKKNN